MVLFPIYIGRVIGTEVNHNLIHNQTSAHAAHFVGLSSWEMSEWAYNYDHMIIEIHYCNILLVLVVQIVAMYLCRY